MAYLTLALFVSAVDQLVKVVVTMKLEPLQNIQVIKNVFSITCVHNYGAAFGVLQSQTLLLIMISVVVILLVWFNRGKLAHYSKIFQIGLAVALGGVLGNLVDRIRLGYVIDYLDFQIWPVFNIADIAIVIGVGLIIVNLYFDRTQLVNLSGKPRESTNGAVGKEEDI